MEHTSWKINKWVQYVESALQEKLMDTISFWCTQFAFLPILYSFLALQWHNSITLTDKDLASSSSKLGDIREKFSI